MSSEIGPDYGRLMSEIRQRIASGEYPVGHPIPSTADLKASSGLSITSVRRAVRELQIEGVLEGHPGKRVFVKAKPEEVSRARADLGELGQRLGQVEEKASKAPDQKDFADLRDEVADLRQRLGELETTVMDLVDSSATHFPNGGEHDTAAEQPARRKRAAR